MSAGSVFRQGIVSKCHRSFVFSQLCIFSAVLLALSFFASTVSAYECSERLGLFDKTGIEIPASGLGPNFTQTWPLKNRTGCSINNFTLGNPEVWLWTGTGLTPYAGTVSGSYSTFSLAPNGGTGSVTANFTFNLPPEGAYTIFFDIITDDGNVLEYSMNNPPGYGRLWAVVGVDIAACLAPAPAIKYADHVNLGYDNIAVNTEVENVIEDPTVTVDGNESTMDNGSGDEYNAGDDTDSEGESENEIEAVGDCGLIAYLDYLYSSNYSAYLGVAHKMGLCPPLAGCQAFVGDPVNTAIGNFIQQETDAKVAGPGDSTINLSRTYNSQALLYTPASLRRYYTDGSYEVMAEPPQYFGKGWASELGQYLLEIDMAPTFDGVQILYADGHTANFEKSGNQYISASPGTHDVITKVGNEYVLRDTDCQCTLEEKRFNEDGLLTALVDRNGNRISLIYNGDKLTALENAAGRRVDFEFNGEGRITKAHLPENITLTYEYTDDLLTAFIDGRGGRTEYHYDDFGQMTEIISPNGYPIVRNTYDDQFRVSEQIVKENEQYIFTYEEGKTTVTDSYGNATVHHYDDDLRLVRTEHPDGTAENYTFDEDLNRTKYVDQAGSEWKWTYDEKGNRLTADGPLGWHRNWQYNERRQVTRMTEKVDATTERSSSFSYDAQGNLIEFCNALNACGNITYNSKGQPLNMSDLNGNTTINAYDGEGDLISVTDPEGAMISFSHDGLGRIISKIKPLGNSYGYSYDPNSNLIAVDGPLGFHLGYSYDANANLIQSIDPNGGISNYTYSKSDRIQAVYNQLNFATSFAYGLMNERTGMSDAEGRDWSYTYNSMLRVTGVNGPLGYQQNFIYNALGMITDATDPEGRVKHIEYDPLRRPLAITRNYQSGGEENSDTNVTSSFTYNLIGDRLSVTDPEGYVFTAEYDLQSRLVKKRDAEGYAWEYSYDPMGNLLEKLNPNNFTTSYSYTPTNRLQSVTNPEQHIKSFIYNPNGSLRSTTDPKGTVSEYFYDELDRRTAQVRNSNLSSPADHATNVTTAFAYDLAGNLRFITNPLHHKKEIRYDAAHRKVELIDYEKGSTTFKYDKVNNLLKVIDAEGNSTDYTVDELNRLIAVSNAEDETTQYRYDLLGNRTQLIKADDTVTLYEFDGVYRLNRVHENYRPDVEPGNDVNVLTSYGYDRRGLLTSFINGNGAETIFEHNSVGKLIRETDPLLNVWQYGYDGNRNRITRQDAKGDLTEYEFYPDDMLRGIAYNDGTDVSYEYDANNNRTAMSDKLGETSWEFDPLNRVTLQNDPFDRVLQYKYDAASNRVGITYPDDNQVDYEYSPNNWLKTMTVGAFRETPLHTEYARDLVGNLTEIDNPNQTRTSIAYDKVYRTLQRKNWQTTKGGKINSGFEYTYNELGHVTKTVKEYGWRKPAVVTDAYEYDGLHRLASMSMSPIKNNGGVVETAYRYDPAGNRLSWQSTDNLQSNTPGDGFSRSYQYNEGNQMLGVEYASAKNSTKDYAYVYSYDANGNRINRQLVDRNGPQYGVDYSYDPENRLILAQDYQMVGGGKKKGNHRIDRAFTTLEYDGGGRRLVQHYDPKQGGNGVDKRDEYVFDGLDPVAEYNMLNGQHTDYYRGAGGHLALMHSYKGGTQGQMYWYHYNNKGDVAGLTKQNGNSHHNYRYDPYGAVLPENGNFTDPHNHYTLTGKEFDENTGLVWFGSRHYEPETGVWVNQDTYRGRLSEPGSLHRFGYVLNNPVSHWDWYGFSDVDINPWALTGTLVDKIVKGPAGKLLGTFVDIGTETARVNKEDPTETAVNITYEYVTGTGELTVNALAKKAATKANIAFGMFDVSKNMWEDYSDQGLGITECFSPSNLKGIATTFYEQPGDMLKYTLEEVATNGLPTLVAATIKTVTLDTVEITGEDVKEIAREAVDYELTPHEEELHGECSAGDWGKCFILIPSEQYNY